MNIVIKGTAEAKNRSKWLTVDQVRHFLVQRQVDVVDVICVGGRYHPYQVRPPSHKTAVNQEKRLLLSNYRMMTDFSVVRIFIHPVEPFACLQCKGWAIAMTLSVCLSVCLYKIRNCEETERLTKKVLEIKVVGYHNANSGVPSAVTLDDL
jgi:hypothetical protein